MKAIRAVRTVVAGELACSEGWKAERLKGSEAGLVLLSAFQPFSLSAFLEAHR
jgi:hypothetical protein